MGNEKKKEKKRKEKNTYNQLFNFALRNILTIPIIGKCIETLIK